MLALRGAAIHILLDAFLLAPSRHPSLPATAILTKPTIFSPLEEVGGRVVFGDAVLGET